MAYIGIDVHNTASQIAVLPEEPTDSDVVEPLEEIRSAIWSALETIDPPGVYQYLCL